MAQTHQSRNDADLLDKSELQRRQYCYEMYVTVEYARDENEHPSDSMLSLQNHTHVGAANHPDKSCCRQ